MKHTFSKTIGVAALAILMMAAFAQISVSAQDVIDEQSDEQTQEDAKERHNNARRLEGVWNFQVTSRNCQTGAEILTFSAMFTYMRGGTLNEFGTRNSPALRTHGMGIWRYESRRQYTSAHQFFRFNADGTLAGKQINRAQIQMSHDGNSFTTIGNIQVLDVNGNVIQNNCATAIATRFE